MVNQRSFSTKSNEIEIGQIYDEFSEDLQMLNNAYDAMNNFCRKEQKKSKIIRKPKVCWQ